MVLPSVFDDPRFTPKEILPWKVNNNLLDPLDIDSYNRRKASVALTSESEALLLCLQLEHVHYLLQLVLQIHTSLIRGEFPVADPE